MVPFTFSFSAMLEMFLTSFVFIIIAFISIALLFKLFQVAMQKEPYSGMRELPPEEWIKDTVLFFHEHGFFHTHSDTGNRALVDKLKELFEKTYQRDINPNNEYEDFYLLSLDKEMVKVMNIPEQPHEWDYGSLLKFVETASQNSMISKNVNEGYDIDHKTYNISFDVEDVHISLANRKKEMLHPSIVNKLNIIILQLTGKVIYPIAFDGQYFILFASPYEIKNIQQQRFW